MLVFGEWSVLDLAVLKAVQLNPVFNLYFLNDTECGAKRNSAYIFTFYKRFLASSCILFILRLQPGGNRKDSVTGIKEVGTQLLGA